MIEREKALLLIGSPKPAASTSASLGDYLLDRLREKGMDTDGARVYWAIASDDRVENLVESVNDADLVILAFPLYVDTLPAGVIRFLEMVSERGSSYSHKHRRLAAIVNCGFPETTQCEMAVASCRRFAEEAEFDWAGGLALGGAGAIDGRPLEKVGRATRNVKKALDMAADDLASGRAISEEAIALMARRTMPRWLYTFAGNLGFRREARKNGIRGNRLADRPYGKN